MTKHPVDPFETSSFGYIACCPDIIDHSLKHEADYEDGILNSPNKHRRPISRLSQFRDTKFIQASHAHVFSFLFWLWRCEWRPDDDLSHWRSSWRGCATDGLRQSDGTVALSSLAGLRRRCLAVTFRPLTLLQACLQTFYSVKSLKATVRLKWNKK
jgi:hypothetical protein